MKTSFRPIIAGLTFASVALIGCSSDDDNADSTTAAPASADAPATTAAGADAGTPAAAGTLTIEGFAFGGGTFTANEPITVVNNDAAPHTVTADDDSFSVQVAAGTEAELAIEAPGTYPIHCEVHPQMSGSITVG